MEEKPIPTPAAPDPASPRARPHQRSSDPDAEMRVHKRWYDSVKMQLAIAAGVISFGGTMVGIGFSLDQFVFKVENAPIAIAANRERLDSLALVLEGVPEGGILVEHNRMWQSINANRVAMVDLEEKMDDVVQTQLELLCYMTTADANGQRSCVQQQTQDRIRRMITGRPTPQPGGTP